jgi:hypothetical protein
MDMDLEEMEKELAASGWTPKSGSSNDITEVKMQAEIEKAGGGPGQELA